MSYRPLIIAALLGAAAAQPDAQCNTEVMAVALGGTTVSDATCTALATLEGCIARVTDRATQSALEITLSGWQTQMQGCTATPNTAAIRTARDEIEVTAAQVVFARTVRQLVNVHELQQQVNTNEDALSATIASVEAAVTSTLAANTAVMQARMDAAAATATSVQSSLADSMSRLTATTAASVSTSAAATDARVNAQLSAAAATNVVAAQRLNAQLAAAAASSAVTARSLNASVQAAIVAANNAAVPQVYIQWGSKTCSAPSGVRVVKLYDGVTYGTRHQYSGGGGNELCLKNSAGDQGGVRQGGQDSNDMIVPMRLDHTNYNAIPSRNNLIRSRQGWIVPCAKCKYAKSCFEESGVAECPSGYHKMYTGYMFGGHQSHSGNNDRLCIDRNPADNDYTSSANFDGHFYATIARDGRGTGLLRNNRVVPACHMCCVR